MSEHTRTPWRVEEVDGRKYERAIKWGDYFVATTHGGASWIDPEANARHIVHCVNNHERLVEALRSIQNDIAETGDVSDESCDMMDTLISDLAALEAEKGGEL